MKIGISLKDTVIVAGSGYLFGLALPPLGWWPFAHQDGITLGVYVAYLGPLCFIVSIGLMIVGYFRRIRQRKNPSLIYRQGCFRLMPSPLNGSLVVLLIYLVINSGVAALRTPYDPLIIEGLVHFVCGFLLILLIPRFVHTERKMRIER